MDKSVCDFILFKSIIPRLIADSPSKSSTTRTCKNNNVRQGQSHITDALVQHQHHYGIDHLGIGSVHWVTVWLLGWRRRAEVERAWFAYTKNKPNCKTTTPKNMRSSVLPAAPFQIRKLKPCEILFHTSLPLCAAQLLS